MKVTLPQPIAIYFDVSNGADIARLAQCFAPDATVIDEAQTHHGQDAILDWQAEAKKKFEYSVDPLSVSHNGDQVKVTANVVGNFPGSPVQLDHVFLLAGDKIQFLEIK